MAHSISKVETPTVWVVELAVGHWMDVGVGVGVEDVLEVEEVVEVAGGGVNTGVGELETLELELELELVVALVVGVMLLGDDVTASGVDEEVCEETALVTELWLVVLVIKDDDSDTDMLESADVELESVSVADVVVKVLVKVVESLGTLLVMTVVGVLAKLLVRLLDVVGTTVLFDDNVLFVKLSLIHI